MEESEKCSQSPPPLVYTIILDLYLCNDTQLQLIPQPNPPKLHLSKFVISPTMRTMVDLGNRRGPIHVIDTSVAVDCTKDVGLRRSFRSLMGCVVPCLAFQLDSSDSDEVQSASSSVSVVTGTFFGHRKGRVNFCFHEASKTTPLLLLEFAVPTTFIAREMQHGLLRLVLVSSSTSSSTTTKPSSLFNIPTWSLYCNGRKMGFAVRRKVTGGDTKVFKLMKSITTGAGFLPGESMSGEGELMYLRASFKRVIGSSNSESFHIINPVGSCGQELSIFLLRT